MVRIEPAWRKVMEAFAGPERAEIIYVLGGSDTGKSTFCGFVREQFSKTAALIDCDPGQSAIGPPATVGARLPDGTECLCFVGSTSPQGHLLQTVGGIKKLADWALARGARVLVLDSSGFVAGMGALEFQFQVIDLVRPTHIVAFQRGLELEGILSNFAIPAHRLLVSRAVVPRSVVQRQAYRRERFSRYFQDAREQILGLEGLGLHGMVPEDLRACSRRLIAVCDTDNFVLVLGIIEAVDPERGLIELLAPEFDVHRARSIQFGSVLLDRSGRELPV